MADRCECGRALTVRPGDLTATCAECRSTPDSCDCPPLSSGRHAMPVPDIPGDPLPDEPWTELGYARRLVSLYGDQLRYVPAWRRWLIWDGRRWTRDETGYAARLAKLTARRMTDVALGCAGQKGANERYLTAKRNESSSAVNAVLNLAGTELPVAVAHGELDADPMLINCTNGVLDLRTMKLGGHDPALLLTKVTRAAYRPDAEGPEFARFLELVQPDDAMRAFLARLLGHALEGRVSEHILPIFHGVGGNGKSTLTDAVQAALGDYAGPADPDLLTARTFDAHPTGTADLFGLRLALLHESDKGRRLAEGTVKRLTGGDMIKARRMREDFWSFAPSHTFVMLTNHEPVITGTDEGIWRRIKLVPWDVQIPEADRELGWAERHLLPELDAILAWLCAGYSDWKQRGLDEPAAVKAATDAYRGGSDAVARFLEECCMDHGEAASAHLYAAWQKWCAQEGEQAGTQKAFSTEILNHGYDKQHKSTGWFWQGLCLTDDTRGSDGL